MKIKTLSTLLLPLPVFALLAFHPASASQEPSPAPKERRARPDQRPDSGVQGESGKALEKAMDGLKDSQKSLRSLLADPVANKDTILSTLMAMEGYCTTAYGEEPPHVEKDVTEEQWALHVIGFKSSLLELQSTVLAMETATWQGDVEALKKGYEALNASKKQGHDKYKPEEH